MRREDRSPTAIIKWADDIAARLTGVSKEQFLRSMPVALLTRRSVEEPAGQETLQPWAVLDALKEVGEAAARLPSALKTAHPEVDWRRVAGFGDLVGHAWAEGNWDAVWAAATVDVPYLRAVLVGAGPLVPAGWLEGPTKD